MAQTYDLKYDEETKAYKPVDITAVLKHLQQGNYVEVDFSEVEFKADVEKLITFELRHEDKYNIAKVDLDKEALNRADFDEVIKNPVTVHVTAKPPAEAGKAAPPDLKAQCQVQIGPMPAVVKVLRPTPEELPWPANPEKKMPVELQIFRGSETRPLANTAVSLERKTPNDPPCGQWDATDGPPKTTDDQGKISLTFVPSELYYKPGGKYFEEYSVFTGEGANRHEIGSFKLELAPKLRFRLEIEKKGKFTVGQEEKEFAVAFEEKPAPVELELGPSLKIDALEVEPGLPDDGQASQTKIPVAFAKLKLIFLDKEDKETPLSAEPQETDTQGQHLYQFRELTAAFKGATTYKLKEHDQQPVGKLNEGAEATIKNYHDHVQGYTPKELLDGTLYQDLLNYRKTFCAQMAAQKPERFATIESAAEILSRAATHTKLFNDMYNDQWARMGDVFGNALSDLLSLVVTMTNFGDKVVKEWAPNVGRYFGDWISELASKRWVRVALRYLRRKLNQGLRAAHGYLDDIFSWLGRTLPGTLQSIAQKGREGLLELGRNIDELVNITAPPESTLGEVAEKMKEWLISAFRLVFNAIGTILKILADALVGIIAVITRGLAAVFAAARDALAPVLADYVRPALQSGLELICRAFGQTYDAADHSTDKVFLSKAVEVAIAWINERFKLTSKAGDCTGKGVVKTLVLMDWLADPVIERVKSQAEKLNVATPHTQRTDLYRDFCNATRNAKHKDELSNADIDEWISHLDNFILCTELIIMLVVTLFSLGGGAALSGIFTQVETAFGIFKLALIRFPQALAVVVLAMIIAFMYTVGTLALKEKGSAAAAP